MKNKDQINVGIGKIVYAQQGGLVCSALGSCIALVLQNTVTHQAGMAHILLPFAPSNVHPKDCPGKYADYAIPELLNQLLPSGLSPPDYIRAFISGGAQMFPLRQAAVCMNIGEMNIHAVEEALAKQCIPIAFCDVGGNRARRAAFDIQTETMMVSVS